jgi:CreA protein
MEVEGETMCCGEVLFVATSAFARADDLSCISMTFNLLSPNDKVCVTDSQRSRALHATSRRLGKADQPLGLNEDPSNFSVACRQVGPINVDISKLTDDEEVFSEKTSIIFKATRIYRMLDKKHNTLVYVAVSSKIVSGSPANSISSVPIMPWGLQ